MMALFRGKQWLQQHGKKVDAQVTSVTGTAGPAGGRINVNLGQNVYVVTAVWTDPQTQTNYTFEKRCLSDSAPHIQEGQTIVVYLDPDDEKRYHMDIDC